MLEKTVRKLLQRQSDVFETDFLADDVKGHGRKTGMHRPQHAAQDRPVADAGIEDAHRRRPRTDIAEFHCHAVGDDPLLTACVDEKKIFLPVVEKAEIGLPARAHQARRIAAPAVASA